MHEVSSFYAASAAGVDFVAAHVGLCEEDLLAFGATPDQAAEALSLCATYFGQTRFTGKQRSAVSSARRSGHALPVLVEIERWAARAKTQKDAWDLRVVLCRTPAKDVKRVAKARLRKLNPPAEPKPGFRVLRSAKRLWRLCVTAPSHLVADIESAVRAHSSKDPLDAFRALFFEGGASATQVTTNVLVTLDQLDEILDGDGEEITLRLTNGATMTGAEFLARRFSSYAYATLFHPLKGPVNIYRTDRFASDKQRLMAAAESPVCIWPGCNNPADRSQVHHIQSWESGGNTNAANLTMLCSFHNGVNEDYYPGAGPPTRWGRIRRIAGTLRWQPPVTSRAGPGAPPPQPLHV
jgi:hypothetical protein